MWKSRYVNSPRNAKTLSDMAVQIPFPAERLDCRIEMRLEYAVGIATSKCSTIEYGSWNEGSEFAATS